MEVQAATQTWDKNLNFIIFMYTHYSKSQIFVQKFNFDKTLQFSREIKVVNSYKVQILNIFTRPYFSGNQSC